MSIRKVYLKEEALIPDAPSLDLVFPHTSADIVTDLRLNLDQLTINQRRLDDINLLQLAATNLLNLIDAISSGAGVSIDVDTALSATSTNPVLNKAIYAGIPKKVSDLQNDTGYVNADYVNGLLTTNNYYTFSYAWSAAVTAGGTSAPGDITIWSSSIPTNTASTTKPYLWMRIESKSPLGTILQTVYVRLTGKNGADGLDGRDGEAVLSPEDMEEILSNVETEVQNALNDLITEANTLISQALSNAAAAFANALQTLSDALEAVNAAAAALERVDAEAVEAAIEELLGYSQTYLWYLSLTDNGTDTSKVADAIATYELAINGVEGIITLHARLIAVLSGSDDATASGWIYDYEDLINLAQAYRETVDEYINPTTGLVNTIQSSVDALNGVVKNIVQQVVGEDIYSSSWTSLQAAEFVLHLELVVNAGTNALNALTRVTELAVSVSGLSSTVASLATTLGTLASRISQTESNISFLVAREGDENAEGAAFIIKVDPITGESYIEMSADLISIVANEIVTTRLNSTSISIGGGKSYFDSDGSGYVANLHISWDSDGNLNILGEVIGSSITDINCTNRTDLIGKWLWISEPSSSDCFNIDSGTKEEILQSSNTVIDGDGRYILRILEPGSYRLTNRNASVLIVVDLSLVDFDSTNTVGVSIYDTLAPSDYSMWRTKVCTLNAYFNDILGMGPWLYSISGITGAVYKHFDPSSTSLNALDRGFNTAESLIPIILPQNQLIEDKGIFILGRGSVDDPGFSDVTVMLIQARQMAFCGGYITITRNSLVFFKVEDYAGFSAYLYLSKDISISSTSNSDYDYWDGTKWNDLDSSLSWRATTYVNGGYWYDLVGDSYYKYIWPLIKYESVEENLPSSSSPVYSQLRAPQRQLVETNNKPGYKLASTTYSALDNPDNLLILDGGLALHILYSLIHNNTPCIVSNLLGSIQNGTSNSSNLYRNLPLKLVMFGTDLSEESGAITLGLFYCTTSTRGAYDLLPVELLRLYNQVVLVTLHKIPSDTEYNVGITTMFNKTAEELNYTGATDLQYNLTEFTSYLYNTNTNRFNKAYWVPVGKLGNPTADNMYYEYTRNPDFI